MYKEGHERRSARTKNASGGGTYKESLGRQHRQRRHGDVMTQTKYVAGGDTYKEGIGRHQ